LDPAEEQLPNWTPVRVSSVAGAIAKWKGVVAKN
jgi:hypothetical protein